MAIHHNYAPKDQEDTFLGSIYDSFHSSASATT